jgi:hypothetical protein
MNSTSNIGFVRRLAAYMSIALATLLSPGIAGADEIMLSEITVVALAIDVDAQKREATEAAIDDALDRVREQVRLDTEAHLQLSIEPTEAPTVERIARAH